MQQKKVNWILEKMEESLNKNGYLTESDLRLLRVQIGYRDEFLSLLDSYRANTHVASYLFINKTGQCMDLLETFLAHEKVKSYIFMTKQIAMVNEIADKIRNGGWCHHILVPINNGHKCVRCGIDVSENFDCSAYTLIVADDFDYEEAKKLYDEAVFNLENISSINDIINEMLRIKRDRKVKLKQFI